MTIKAILLHEPLPRKKMKIVNEGMTKTARTITDTKFRGGQNGYFFVRVYFLRQKFNGQIPKELRLQVTNVDTLPVAKIFISICKEVQVNLSRDMSSRHREV
jgi:hypothetical protein